MPKGDLATTTRVPGLLLWYAGQQGLDPKALARAHRLPDDVDLGTPGLAELTMQLDSQAALFDEVARTLGDPHLGLSLAAAVPKGAYGVAEFLILSAPKLRQAFANLVRFNALLSRGLRFAFEETAEVGRLTTRLPFPGATLGVHAGEFSLGMFALPLRTLCPGAGITRAWFAHERPSDVAPVERFFGTSDLEWGLPTSGYEVPRAQLDFDVKSGDPALHRFLEETAVKALAARPRSTELTESLRHHLTQALEQGEPNIERLAVRLHLSARTLQRRLADLQTSFQEVLDGVRYDLARGYLKDTSLDVSQVAYLLGYSDLRAFNRAFKRWTGKAPTAWRGGAPASAATES